MKKKYKIVFTGGSGRFGSVLKKIKTDHKILFPAKKDLNILSFTSIRKYLLKKKPDIFIHAAALSRPMDIHEKNINKSIDVNILGTANVTKACFEKNIKLIYFSTNYVYPSTKGNYNEKSPLFPINNYAWSKLGGEAAVQLYKNSLVLRICMTEKPFTHKEAFTDVKTNFIFHEDIAKTLFKILDFNGIINIGGKIQSVFNFARKYNKNIKKISGKVENFPLNPSMDISKLEKLLSKK